jgi:signal transduction histidine kinase
VRAAFYLGSGKHLRLLINDILDLSKVEAGKMLLDLEPIQLHSLLDDSLAIIREKAGARNIQLKLDARGEERRPVVQQHTALACRQLILIGF